MAHTYRQDLAARLNTLSFDFAEAQKQVQQLSANITTINNKMHSTIYAKIQLEARLCPMLCRLLTSLFLA
jgi:hypothetical protein